LKLCAKKARWSSDTVAAALVPKNFSRAGVIARALNRYNVSGGLYLAKLASALCPLGHLGELTEVRLMAAISGAEMVMLNGGIKACTSEWYCRCSKVLAPSFRAIRIERS
jgi:alanine-glyoxylate transaminase/serine-glyoxylate transaminase/serine-pyruvate transaminase